jgi:hypothetical protein
MSTYKQTLAIVNTIAWRPEGYMEGAASVWWQIRIVRKHLQA